MAIMSILIILLVIVVAVGVGFAIAFTTASLKKDSEKTEEGSYFDGNIWQLMGYRILSVVVCTLTFGIAYPWMLCMVQNWETKHTVINGRRLKFNGHGHQLIGKYLLWIFLTAITCGIYSIWFGLSMKKWVVKHTVYADDENPVESYFSGGAAGYLGIHLLSYALTCFTFGIGKAWGDKMVLEWEAKHTHIGGNTLMFNGTGGQLFVKYLIFAILTPLTLGLYAIFFPVTYTKWKVKHTEAVLVSDGNAAKSNGMVLPIVLGIVGGLVVLVIGAVILGAVLGVPFLIFKNTEVHELNEPVQYVAEAELVKSLSAHVLLGEDNDVLDYQGNTLHYVFDDDIFFDYEDEVLYIEFAVIEYKYPVCVTNNDNWKTESLQGSGVFKVEYHFEDGPESLYIKGETFISKKDINVTSGDSDDAQEWLDARYNSAQNPDAPSDVPSDTPSDVPSYEVEYTYPLGNVKINPTDEDFDIFLNMVRNNPTLWQNAPSFVSSEQDTKTLVYDYIFKRGTPWGLISNFDIQSQYVPHPNYVDTPENFWQICRYDASDINWLVKALFGKTPEPFAKGEHTSCYYEGEYFYREAVELYTGGSEATTVVDFDYSYEEWVRENEYRFMVNITTVYGDGYMDMPAENYTWVFYATPMHSQNFGTYWRISEFVQVT